MIGKKICCILSAIFMLLNFSGCTILGYIAGNHIDTRKATIDPPHPGKTAENSAGYPAESGSPLWSGHSGQFPGDQNDRKRRICPSLY